MVTAAAISQPRALGRVVEHARGTRPRRQQRDALEAREVHAEAPRVLEEQLGVRPAGDQPAGLLLVQVLGELAPHRGDRALHVRPADQHREVAHVGRVLLLEVHVQQRLGHAAAT